MDIHQTVTQYCENLQAISDYFEDADPYHVEPNLDKYWAIQGGSCLTMSEEKFILDEDEPEYSYDIRNAGKMFWRKPEYCLAYVYNGFGQEFYVLLDSKKEIK